MGFNINGGLSEMGKTIATTAGDMLLTAQRADLERQRTELAESLAEGRETRGRVQAADIADKASTKEQTWRSGEAVLTREHEDQNLSTREAGDDRRALLSANTTLKAASMSDDAANARLDKQIAAQVDAAAKLAATDHQKTMLDAAIKNATRAVPVMDKDGKPAQTASGAPIIRNVTDGSVVYNSLKGKPGLEDMAAIFKPPKKAAVDGKPKPPLKSFLSGGG